MSPVWISSRDCKYFVNSELSGRKRLHKIISLKCNWRRWQVFLLQKKSVFQLKYFLLCSRQRLWASVSRHFRFILQAHRHGVPSLLRQHQPEPGLHHPGQDRHTGVSGQEPGQQSCQCLLDTIQGILIKSQPFRSPGSDSQTYTFSPWARLPTPTVSSLCQPTPGDRTNGICGWPFRI